MPDPAIVYSSDNIRGRIVLNTLRVHGISSLLFTNHQDIEDYCRKRLPSVIILDTKENFTDEVHFLKDIAFYNPLTPILVLSSPNHWPFLKSLELDTIRFIPYPIDPEKILKDVRGIISKPFSIWALYGKVKKLSWALTKITLKTLPIAVSLFIGVVGGYVYWCLSTVPEIEILENYAPYEASRLYTYGNVLLTEFYIERRTFISHDNIPEHVKEAFITVEDTRYYEHGGIDVLRIIGALITDIKKGAFIQGGSTITQQLAKMIFLKPEKTITRKIKEIAISFQLERKYTKDEILGLYLNKAYFGSRAYGIEAAAQAYFGKSTEKLTIPEAALLAALPKAPSKYSPFRNPQKALERRNFILNRMYEMGFITEREMEIYIDSSLPRKFHGRKYKAPYFVDYCRRVLEKKYGERLFTSGLGIFTTLDYRLQQLAERAIKHGVENLQKRVGGDIQAALIAIDPDTGGIKAMVGGTNFWESQFNRVTQAKRQPGSAFKPFVYLTALKEGFKPENMIEDRVVTYTVGGNRWTPRNYNNSYYGKVPMKTALARSLNSATVMLARRVGIRDIIKTAKDLGIKSQIHNWYSSSLGASEVTLMELTSAYAAFVRGKRIEPVCTERIIDKEKIFITDNQKFQESVIDVLQLADIKEMLRAVILEGTGAAAQVLGRVVYGKTGTTNDYADAWFIGFDENIVVGIWVGRDDRTPIGENETGAHAALPIWIEYMKNI